MWARAAAAATCVFLKSSLQLAANQTPLLLEAALSSNQYVSSVLDVNVCARAIMQMSSAVRCPEALPAAPLWQAAAGSVVSPPQHYCKASPNSDG